MSVEREFSTKYTVPYEQCQLVKKNLCNSQQIASHFVPRVRNDGSFFWRWGWGEGGGRRFCYYRKL